MISKTKTTQVKITELSYGLHTFRINNALILLSF